MEDNQGVRCFVASGPLLALTSVLDDDRRCDLRGFDSCDRNAHPEYQNGIPTGPRADCDKPAISHSSGMPHLGHSDPGLSGRAKLFNQPPSEGVILLRFRF